MYIPTSIPPSSIAIFENLPDLSTTQDSITGSVVLAARKVGALRGRAGLAMGTGVAIAFIGAFILGWVAQCIMKERAARKRAKAHVQALAVQDLGIWRLPRGRGMACERARKGGGTDSSVNRRDLVEDGIPADNRRDLVEDGIPADNRVSRPEPIYVGLRLCHNGSTTP
ncbi:hypothetical protein BDZ91DRAFT_145306 [Kalaharituber pfeilii]|nr:hypothetical protein BDZ91DRAFT_145306 [Kalaharituber pfeilii]